MITVSGASPKVQNESAGLRWTTLKDTKGLFSQTLDSGFILDFRLSSDLKHKVSPALTGWTGLINSCLESLSIYHLSFVQIRLILPYRFSSSGASPLLSSDRYVTWHTLDPPWPDSACYLQVTSTEVLTFWPFSIFDWSCFALLQICALFLLAY